MLNLTENQIKTLGHAARNWQTGSRSSGSELLAASPFTIVNVTGYPLYHLHGDTESRVLSGSSLAVTLPTTQARQFAPALTVETEYRRGRYRFSDVRVNRVVTHQLEVADPTEDGKYRLFCDVEMDKGRKVVKFRAPVVLRNETSHDFRAFAGTEWGKREWDVPAGDESPLPFDYSGNVHFLLFHSDMRVWEQVQFHESLQSGTNLHIALSDDCGFVCLQVDESRQCPGRFTVRILPPLVISNALPLQCGVAVSNDRHSLQSAECEVIDSGCRLVNYEVRHDAPIFVKLRVPGFRETDAAKLFVPQKRGKKRTINLTDQSECHAEVLMSVRFEGQVAAFVHAPVIIDNTTSLPLLFLYKKTGIMHRVAGQQTDLILSDSRRKIQHDSIEVHHSFFFCCLTKKLQVEFNKRKSEAFKVSTVGAQKVITIEGLKEKDGHYPLYQLVYNVRFVWPLSDNEIYCRLITVSPRLIVNNLLSKPLLLYQVGSRKPTVLRSRTSAPFFWPDGKKQELLKLSIAEPEVWEWSGTFSVSSIGACTLQCLHKPTQCYSLIRAEVRQQDIAGLVTFQEESSAHPSYLCENLSQTFSFCIYQEGYRDFPRYIDVNTKTPFAWSSHMQGHVLVVKVLLGPLDGCPLDLNSEHRIAPDAIGTSQRLQIPLSTPHSGVFLYFQVQSRGSTKVLTFTDQKPITPRKHEQSSDYLALVIPLLGISLVENSQKRAAELLFLTLHGLELSGMRSDKLQTVALTIKRVQVDNQYDPLAQFPVFLSIASAGSNDAVQLHLSYYLTGEADCYNFEDCEIMLQEVVLEAESFVVQRLISLSSRLSAEFQPAKSEVVSPITLKYRTSKSLMVRSGAVSYLSQVSTVRIEHMKQISFGHLKIHPVLITITFAPLRDVYGVDESETFDMLISALGLPIMNIRAAPMKFYSVELRNVFGARWQLFNALASFYRAQVASEIFSIVGHADVIGNPLGILNNLGEGVADLFYEPCKGVMKGPISAGKGLLKGAKSFFSKTIYATFGTLSRVTGTLSMGLNSLSGDKDYQLQMQRERVKNQPKDVVEGLGSGVKALVRSVSKGITGVVVEPYRGAKASGFSGLLKGSIKGVGGLVVQPLTGILDIASHTTEGIVNTAGVFDQRKRPKRVRPPRVTYNDSGVIKPFNEEDAEVCFYMIKMKSDRYLHAHFVQQVLETDAKGESVLYLHYVEFLALVSVKEHRVKWLVPKQDLEAFARTSYGVLIYAKPSQKKVRGMQRTRGQSEFLVPFASKAVMARIAKKLKVQERTGEQEA